MTRDPETLPIRQRAKRLQALDPPIIACGEKASERFRILLLSNSLAGASTDRACEDIFTMPFHHRGENTFLRESSCDTPLVERRIILSKISAASNTEGVGMKQQIFALGIWLRRLR